MSPEEILQGIRARNRQSQLSQSKVWGSDVDGMLMDMLRHAQGCKSGIESFLNPEQLRFGFKCGCGQPWTLKLIPVKLYGGPFRELIRTSEGRRSMADVLNSNPTLENLISLTQVCEVMQT